MSDERDRLLAATVEHATAHGISELSLRQLAAALGTSHRMLVYYFGSKEELLVEVTKAVEAQQRASLEQLAVDDGADPEAQMRAFATTRSGEQRFRVASVVTTPTLATQNGHLVSWKPEAR